MEITFDLPHVFNPDSNGLENAYALRALLDCLIKIDIAYLRYHKTVPLYKSGVVYDRTKTWDSTPELYRKKYGDCKSLSAALIAEYYVQNIKALPVFRFVRNPLTGFTDFHILVQRAGGFEDPSRKLGMGADENQKYFGPDSSILQFSQ